MNKPKHTPGPWFNEAHIVLTLAEIDGEQSKGVICSVDGNFTNYPTDCANASFIAAAPDLLAALTKIVIAEFGSLDHPQIKNSGMWASAKAAIEKAVSNG